MECLLWTPKQASPKSLLVTQSGHWVAASGVSCSPFLSLQPVTSASLVYAYRSSSYEGTGVAAWRHGGKWAYQYLGHCSCNGPTEDMRTSDAAKFSLEELKQILTSKDNSWSPEYAAVAKH